MLGGRAVRHAAMLGDLACARAHVHSTLACFAYAVHVWPVHPMQGGWPQVTRPLREVGGEGWRGFGCDQRQSCAGQTRGGVRGILA